MLVLLPASEAKRPVSSGPPADLSAMSFPAFVATRSEVLDALVEASAAPDALRRLGVREGLADVVRANTALRTAPTADAGAVYHGLGVHNFLVGDGSDHAAQPFQGADGPLVANRVADLNGGGNGVGFNGFALGKVGLVALVEGAGTFGLHRGDTRQAVN